MYNYGIVLDVTRSLWALRSVTKVSKYCVESTGCTKGWLMDNNKSNISNEIITWWLLVGYLEQDFKPPRIQSYISSQFSSWLVELAFWASS